MQAGWRFYYIVKTLRETSAVESIVNSVVQCAFTDHCCCAINPKYVAVLEDGRQYIYTVVVTIITVRKYMMNYHY